MARSRLRSNVTSELAQAIANYAKRPNTTRREVVLSLVHEGHLTPAEYRLLGWAIKPHIPECTR